MANWEQVSILKQSVEDWKKWLRENPATEIDLRGANLRGANLRGANLTRADLSEADLSQADLFETDLWRAYLRKANLRGTNFRGANLKGTDLRGADLREAHLRKANLWRADLEQADLGQTDLGESDLRRANLSRANLNGANLSKVTIGLTVFGEIDLSKTNGLEEVIHSLSSYISTDTIQLSKGRIPMVFLRGCGLSDLDIEYAKLASPGLDLDQVAQITNTIRDLYTGSGIQFRSCFISYNNKDQDFAKRLHDDLQDNGVRCWFAPEDLKIGDSFRKTIGEQVRLRDKLLVILSKNSIRSEWVGHEVEKALEEEKEHGSLKLFPIRLDNAALNSKDDWAEAIRLRRYIGDFSKWKDPNDYQKGFERLLRDLKTSSTIS